MQRRIKKKDQKSFAVFLFTFQLFIKLVTIMRFKSNMRRFVRLRVPNEMPTSKCPSYRSSLQKRQKTRRANFHRTLLRPTSDYQARSPWTEIGGNHLATAIKYPIRAPGASGASPKMCVAWRCPDGRQFGLS